MACFFRCFRVRDGDDDENDNLESRGRAHLLSPAGSDRPTEAAGSKNCFSELFVSEEDGGSPATSDDNGHLSWASPRTKKELRDEANFLKACGTLPEIPAELRISSNKLKSSPPVDDGSTHSKLHSWMPNTSTKKLLADMEAEHSTPMKSSEESRRDSISSDLAPSSCISHAQNNGSTSMPSIENSEGSNMKTAVKLHDEETDDEGSNMKTAVKLHDEETDDDGSNMKTAVKLHVEETDDEGSNMKTAVKLHDEETDDEGSNMKTAVKLHDEETDDASSASPFVSAINTQLRNRSVHFQCDYDSSSSKGSSSGSSGHNLKNSDLFGDMSVTRLSTRPTPLKLSSEMQTPGTVFPVDNIGYGKTRVRSQYVRSVLHPIENVSQWHELKEDQADSQVNQLTESIEQSENTTPNREAAAEGASPSKNLKLEASLSAWLKPVSQTTNQNGTGLDLETFVSEKNHIGKTPGDRPIIGMVAAHWNDDEPAGGLQKGWDWNGIPNTTTKYKEDQKVSWHATPFEVRLEKALSEESSVSHKKPVISGTPMAFDECEAIDEAMSQLPSVAAATSDSKSVVSY